MPISWPGLHEGRRRAKVSLPTYPFQRQRFLIEPATADACTDVGTVLEAFPEPRGPIEAAVDNDAETGVQQTLKAIFRKVLGVLQLTLHDSFFDLGGDSLIAAQLMTLVSTAFQVKLSASTVYEAPTVAGLATLIEGRRVGQQADIPGRAREPWGMRASPRSGSSVGDGVRRRSTGSTASRTAGDRPASSYAGGTICQR